jgi:nitrite reductase (NO-forming)
MQPGASRALNVLATEPARRGPDRGRDRRLAYLGLGLAIGFIAAAFASLALPANLRLGWWLPLHLALAGAAGTAIAAMLPFFVAALAVAQPAPPALRAAGIALVSLGAAVAAIARVLGGAQLEGNLVAAGGGALYVAGIVAVGLSAGLPLRRASGPRRPATEIAYVVALADVAVGVSLAVLVLAGQRDVARVWDRLRVAHAWLNAFGFVALAVAGTLLHLAPTVAGSRIRARRAGLLGVAGLAAGAPAVALGYGLGAAELARAGAVVAIAGAAALVVHAVGAHRDRAGWTTEHDWHRFTAGSLLVAPAWLLVATAIAGGRTLGLGADPAAWRAPEALAPLVVGFVLQVLLGALAHLVPAIGPGSPARHAAARRVLGHGSTLRLLAWNLGTGSLTVGLVLGPDVLVAAGGALVVASLGASLLLLVLCLRERW